MKAITICQPYAELIRIGEKKIENRHWAINYRGPLVIHAGKSKDYLQAGDLERFPGMPFGAIVATCQLIECFHTQWDLAKVNGIPKIPNDVFDRWPWLQSHKHVEGPWCWLLDDLKPLVVPIPYRGFQGLFEIPDEILKFHLVA